jgi:PncC family amidohydrolase
VSEAAAREMARGVRLRLGAEVGLAVTGVAGPGGGTPDKPVGLTWIGLSARDPTRGRDAEIAQHFVWDSDREGNKALSAEAALRLLQDYLEGRLQGP